jgi:hypothetical protein
MRHGGGLRVEGGGRRVVYDRKALIREVIAAKCLRSGISIRFWRLT